jgi:hypothetical protein
MMNVPAFVAEAAFKHQMNVSTARGPAYGYVVLGDVDGLLSCRGLDLDRTYCDYVHKTIVTLLGLSILKNQYACMAALLWTGAIPDGICASVEFTFLENKRQVHLTGRDLCKTNLLASVTLQLFEMHQAQIYVTQWVLVNIPACWRDLSEDVLRRLRYAY